MDIKYIEAQELIRQVKNEISPYFEKGVLDESFLYPVIRASLGKMGLKIFPLKKDVIRIEDFNSDLPCDFYKMVFAVGCNMENWVDIDYTNTKLLEYEVSGLNICESRCDYCEDSCGNLYGIRQYFNSYSVEYQDLFPVSVCDSRPYCTEECFKQKKSKYEITIKNGKVYTNFETGSLYIEYLTNLESDSGDLMIPDNEVIKEWIKDEMFFICFRKLWRNSEGDMERRYQDAKEQLAKSQVNASNVYKRWTVKDFYDLRKTLYSRFHKYNTAVYGKYYNSKLSVKISSSNKGYVFDRFQ